MLFGWGPSEKKDDFFNLVNSIQTAFRLKHQNANKLLFPTRSLAAVAAVNPLI